MIRQYIIENWLIKPAGHDLEAITRSQIQQTWARVIFAVASMIYLTQHAVYFAQFKIEIILICTVFFIYNALTFASIRRRPLSASRTLIAPLFDTFVVCFGMMADGGHGSGMFYILPIIVIGNSFRFGNALMVYTQVLSVIGLAIMSIYLSVQMQVEPDQTLLVWQLFGLLSIPYYVFMIREKAEQALRGQAEAEETSINLLDQGPLPVFTYNLNHENQLHILYANDAIRKIYQHEGSELLGKRVDTFTLPEDSEEMLGFCSEALLQEQQVDTAPVSRSIYIRGRDKSGNVLRLICYANRLRWHEQWIGICFILDITERETLQAQLDIVHRQGFMSTLVAGIVHDFRNVLTNMIGYAEILHMADNNDENREQLAAIINAGERGSELITHLLKLSKEGSAETLDQFTEGTKLAQPLENIIGLARMQLPPHIQLHYDILNPLHDVAISIIEIEQILLNLIHNATNAIHQKGRIYIHISSKTDHIICKGGEQPALCIKVVDNGIGIPDADLEKIFMPFWTSRDKKGGSGLGLTMVQRIIKQRHGTIEVESNPGGGSCFTIHLPSGIRAGADNNTSDAQRGASAKPSLTSISPCHILLVDDAPDILQVHQALISREGHSSTTAGNGKQALELFLRPDLKFDIIITDYRMPVMNGLDLVEAIREHDPIIPVLMITAYGEDEALQSASQLGAIILNKPITFNSLHDSIVTALSQQPPTVSAD